MKEDSLKKYRPFPKINLKNRKWPDNTLIKSPIWCSVDLRDGNQALATPMNIQQKLILFKLLVNIGFKEIEIGFPSASDTEFNFVRKLIDEKLIPDDVTIQVLVQAREHLINKTFEALQGAKNAIIHVYNSTSPLQRKITFSDASKEKIKKIATDAAHYILETSQKFPKTNFSFQYSPESFSDTEIKYSIEICEEVFEIWEKEKQIKKVIFNLPATVEWSTANIYADQIEYFCKKFKYRKKSIISLHTHNDRGTGTAASELGLLAGADRIEGTLFGNGERTGNLDLVNIALNLNSHGIRTDLDFSNLEEIKRIYKECTNMPIHPRHPYSGELVFTAFSGSHQDAIKKGFDRIKKNKKNENFLWEVPYLTINPEDIGRDYKAIIRINSQSGKGGIAYILENKFGIKLPKNMQIAVGHKINQETDKAGREFDKNEIFSHFKKNFVNLTYPIKLLSYKLEYINKSVICNAQIKYNNKNLLLKGTGNGPINSFVNAIKKQLSIEFSLKDYISHSLENRSDASASAYVAIASKDKSTSYWGCGINPNIEKTAIMALISAINMYLIAKIK